MQARNITKKFLAAGLLAAVALVGVFWLSGNNQAAAVPRDSNGEMYEIISYRSDTCGCCIVHGDYLSDRGYEVEQVNIEDMATIKDEYGVPGELTSCHTTIVKDGKYIIEGHIPTEAIDELLAERPEI